MNRKIISLVTAFMMVAGSALPAYAQEVTVPVTEQTAEYTQDEQTEEQSADEDIPEENGDASSEISEDIADDKPEDTEAAEQADEEAEDVSAADTEDIAETDTDAETPDVQDVSDEQTVTDEQDASEENTTADETADETAEAQEEETAETDNARTDEADSEEVLEEEQELYAGMKEYDGIGFWDASTSTLILDRPLDSYRAKIGNSNPLFRLIESRGYALDPDDIEYIKTRPGAKAPENCNALFYNLRHLKEADLRYMDISDIVTAYMMFSNDEKLEAVYFGNSGKKTTKLNDLWSMFFNCKSLKELDLFYTDLDFSNVTDASYVFEKCSSLEYLRLPDSTLRPVRAHGFLSGATSLKKAVFYVNSNGDHVLFDGSNLSKNSESNAVFDFFNECNSLEYLCLPKGFTVYSSMLLYNKTADSDGWGIYNDNTGWTVSGNANYAEFTAPVSGYYSQKRMVKPNFKLSSTTNRVAISWEPVNGASSYRIYREKNGSFTFLKEVKQTNYTDTGLERGTTYNYLVRAFRGNIGSPYSMNDVKSISTTNHIVSKPTFILVSGNRQVSVIWDKVPEADTYRVYRVDNGKYKFLTETKSLSYTASGLTNGVKYGFLVRAFKGSVGSDYSDSEIKYAIPATVVPAKPSFTAEASTGSVTLKWNRISVATGYRVYRYENGKYTFLKEVTGTSFTDTGLVNGRKYGYLVRTFYGNTGSAYTNSDIRYATPVAKPVISATAGNKQAVLKWNKVAGAQSYRVYKVENGRYVAVANITGTAYTVTGLKSGTRYGFLVRAFNSSGGSAYTASDIVYVSAK